MLTHGLPRDVTKRPRKWTNESAVVPAEFTHSHIGDDYDECDLAGQVLGGQHDRTGAAKPLG